MTITIILLISVIAVALAFEFINGFHDCANAIATVVSTKVLSPKQAVLFGASLEFIGALTGTHVAKTIGAGIVNADMITLTVIFCALSAAVLWNLFTWWLGLPSSSSHALIGGLLGATIVKAGVDAIHIQTLMDKVIIPMFTSPVLGFCVGFTLMLLIAWVVILLKEGPQKVNNQFRKLQLLSSGLMALSHGSNDAQKTMGIITLALLAGGVLHKSPTGDFPYGIVKQIWLQEDVAVSRLYGVYTPLSYETGYLIHTYFEQSNNANNYLRTLAQKGAKNTINITTTHFLDKSIPFPSSQADVKLLVGLFTRITDRIESGECKLSLLMQQRKTLMQQLFI